MLNTEDSLLLAATSLADDIIENRRRAPDGSLTWLGPRSPWRGASSLAGESPKMVQIGPHLYSGVLGVSIFLAALARTLGDPYYEAECLHTVSSLRQRLDEIVNDPQRAEKIRFGVGGLTGLGSFIYSFVTIGKLLNVPHLIREAHEISVLITPERIAADRVLDITTGGAGMILALLALDHELPEPNRNGMTPIEIAGLCAMHLLDRHLPGEDGLKTWKTLPDFPPLAGFAHGTAGICCALLQLYGRTGRQELWEAAQTGLAFERRAYLPEHKNWRDLRFQDGQFMNGWCHGAPGIMLGRLATLDVAEGEEIRAEISSGLETTGDPSLGSFDHVCCGNMGRADALVYAYHKLREPSLLESAREISRRVLERKEQTTGRFRWMLGGDFDPAFFSGAAGIGYSLLRVAQVEDLPCILIME
ncbi:MAG TPA: lanthionine synthetase LanC family protein [Thermoanaerobaculia bacterium]|jgi:type 2 lantibiotic biosynthesis protein LanM|nr:lanthionine synthetase LanC family protein [Thermoanaerobaculia bacterium]